MKKYQVRFCNCGRIQFIQNELWDWMAEDCEHRRVIQVCQNCGTTVMHFLTENGEGFDMNGQDIRDTDISTDDGITYKFLFHHGEKVPLMCGVYADTFQGGKYINWDYCRDTLGTTYLPAAEATDPDCCKVDIQRLIREIGDEDKIRSMSGYAVGIDWSGTPYDWRKK